MSSVNRYFDKIGRLDVIYCIVMVVAFLSCDVFVSLDPDPPLEGGSVGKKLTFPQPKW